MTVTDTTDGYAIRTTKTIVFVASVCVGSRERDSLRRQMGPEYVRNGQCTAGTQMRMTVATEDGGGNSCYHSTSYGLPTKIQHEFVRNTLR